jgi:hypothetical protein
MMELHRHNLIAVHDALQVTNLTQGELDTRVKSGIVRSYNLTGVTYLDQIDLYTSLSKENNPLYLKHSDKKGQLIGLREAQRKYGIPARTISGWIDQGKITVLGKSGLRVLVDEADIAYMAELRTLRQGRRGTRIATASGDPYKVKPR